MTVADLEDSVEFTNEDNTEIQCMENTLSDSWGMRVGVASGLLMFSYASVFQSDFVCVQCVCVIM